MANPQERTRARPGLIETASRDNVFIGCLIGAAPMAGAGLVQASWGVAAERRALEHVAAPPSTVPDS